MGSAERWKRIQTLQNARDNILLALMRDELSHEATLRLETTLSSVEDELVLLLTDAAA